MELIFLSKIRVGEWFGLRNAGLRHDLRKFDLFTNAFSLRLAVTEKEVVSFKKVAASEERKV